MPAAGPSARTEVVFRRRAVRYLDADRLVGEARRVDEDKVSVLRRLGHQDVRRAAPEGRDLSGLGRRQYDHRPWSARLAVVVLTTAQPGEIPAFRRSATNILVAEAPQYGHFVFVDAPGLAYEAIRVEIAALRGGGTLPPCAQTVLPRIGAFC